MRSVHMIVLAAGSSMLLCHAYLAVSAEDKSKEGKEEKDYVFKEDTSRWVLRLQNGTLAVGQLDDAGDFVERVKDPPLPVYNKPLEGKGREDDVYEYRSGALIKGRLLDTGNFQPEADSTIISFKDYRFGKDDRRIYNLPGRFVEKDMKKDK